MIEKQQDGSVGLKLSVAGLFVLNICDDLSVKSGSCIEPGIFLIYCTSSLLGEHCQEEILTHFETK